MFKLVAMHGSRLDELPSPDDKFFEFSLRFVRHLLGFEVSFGSELCQDFCINLIGLCEDAETLCVVAYSCGIDDTKRDFGMGECDDEVFFVAAGCFAEYERGRCVFDPVQELLPTFGRVVKLFV